MRLFHAFAASLLAFAAATAHGDPNTTHTQKLRSARIELRCRPGSLAAATAEATLDAAERDLDRIGASLEVKPKGPFTLWIYDDLFELSAITGSNGLGGYTSGRDVNIPVDNPQTRLHELVHAVHGELAKTGDEPRNVFFHEGLANAVVEFVDGVHVHAVAGFYLKQDRLPALKTLTEGDFYAYCRKDPKFRSYDVAGSWVRFLFDRYGAAKLKQYVLGAPAKTAFGAEADALEKSWRDFVGKFPIRDETERLLRQGAGEAAAFEPYVKGLPKELVGKASDWKPLLAAKMKLDDLEKWNREDGVITGTNPDAPWSFCDLGDEEWGDCAVRATIKTPHGSPIALRLGDANRALLVNGTFIYRGDAYLTHSTATQMTPAKRETDFVLVRRGPHLEIWIDGVKVLTGAAVVGNARVGIGVALGTATFTDVRARKP
jgi:hypothetical protein